MTKIKKITVENATITIDSATTLQFHHNNCYEIQRPYIFVTAYRCEDYVLLHELQGFMTDKIIGPKTNEEFQNGLMTRDNPFYFDNYHELYDDLKIEKEKKKYCFKAFESSSESYVYDDEESFKRFHLFKIDDKAWTEEKLDLEVLYSESLIKWTNFANGILSR